MQDQTLVTSGLQSSFGFVLSPGATAATNGGWDPNWDSSADEVPGDGVRPSRLYLGTDTLWIDQ